MSDPAARLDAMLAHELSRPVATDPARKTQLMALVHAAPRPGSQRRASRRALRDGWALGGWVSSVAGMALAASITMAVVLDGAGGARGSVVVDGGMPAVATGAGLSDSLASSFRSIRDTLRLVRFVLIAPSASSVALVGDFNAWDPRSSPMVSGKAGRWIAAVAMGPGTHRYSFVVNDTQWIADPDAPRATDSLGRPRSQLTLERDSL